MGFRAKVNIARQVRDDSTELYHTKVWVITCFGIGDLYIKVMRTTGVAFRLALGHLEEQPNSEVEQQQSASHT